MVCLLKYVGFYKKFCLFVRFFVFLVLCFVLEGCFCEFVLFWSIFVEFEFIVYGCICDWLGDLMEWCMCCVVNCCVLDSLLGSEVWLFFGCEMFSCCE